MTFAPPPLRGRRGSASAALRARGEPEDGVQPQMTLAAVAVVEGLGIHSGKPARLSIGPAAPDAGVSFLRTDLAAAAAIPARAERVSDTRLATVLAGGDGATVSTVEHLMAALAGLGVDNARIEIDGPELPILEGAAAGFVEAIERAGLAAQPAPRRWLKVIAPVEVIQPGKRVALSPASRLELSVEIVFEASAIGRQRIDLCVDPASFRSEIAAAKTFGFIAEVELLRAAGLGRGASLENTVVVDGAQVLNPQILARPDDFVRHKALDALGDLALAGRPILGRYEGYCAGHALNNQLVRALLASPESWELTEDA